MRDVASLFSIHLLSDIVNQAPSGPFGLGVGVVDSNDQPLPSGQDDGSPGDPTSATFCCLITQDILRPGPAEGSPYSPPAQAGVGNLHLFAINCYRLYARRPLGRDQIQIDCSGFDGVSKPIPDIAAAFHQGTAAVMVPGPGRSSIAVGALHKLQPVTLVVNHGMDLLVDHNVWIL